MCGRRPCIRNHPSYLLDRNADLAAADPASGVTPQNRWHRMQTLRPQTLHSGSRALPVGAGCSPCGRRPCEWSHNAQRLARNAACAGCKPCIRNHSARNVARDADLAAADPAFGTTPQNRWRGMQPLRPQTLHLEPVGPLETICGPCRWWGRAAPPLGRP